MANKETSWILNLVDQVTKPMENIISSVKASTKVIDENTARVILGEEKTKSAAKIAKKYHKDVRDEAKKTEETIKRLQETISKPIDASSWVAAKKELSKAEDRLNELEKYEKSKPKTGNILINANQAMEVIQKVSSMLDFANPILNTRNEIERMTSAAGKDLDQLVSKIHRVGKVFNENDEDIARAANTMQKTWGGSYQDMVALMEKGYEKGANINGKLLSSMQRYPSQMKQIGLSAKETMALIAQADIKGGFSDKAIAAVKEADESLKYLTKKQITALKGINISAADLRGKTSWDAIKFISDKMKESSSAEARQAVLSSIFRSAGEDAGMEFITGLGSLDLNIENLPTVKQAGAGIKGFMADIQSWVANTFGESITYLKAFGDASVGVVGVISLFQTLSKVTVVQTIAIKAATAAQKLWSVAMVSTPIGVVVAAVLALGIAVYAITKKVRESTEAWKQQQSMMRINEELNKYAIQSTIERTTKLKLLTETAANEKLSLDKRKEALRELIKEDARYQSALKDGIILTDKLRQTTAELTKEIYENALAEGRKHLITQKSAELAQAKIDRQKQGEIYDSKTNFGLAVEAAKGIVGLGMFPEYDAAQGKVTELERDIKNLSKQIGADELKQDKNKIKTKGTESNIPVLGTLDSWFADKEVKSKKPKTPRDQGAMSIAGGGRGGSKTITQHLTINNYFTRTGNSDDRSFSDKIITQINDGLRDAVATI